MKYLLFAYDEYYPAGGLNDSLGFSTDIESAYTKVFKLQNTYRYFQILDLSNGMYIEYTAPKDSMTDIKLEDIDSKFSTHWKSSYGANRS